MTKRNQVYRCEKCGNLINIVHDADANLVCCGEEMKLLEPNTVDAAEAKTPVLSVVAEKHIPEKRIAEQKAPKNSKQDKQLEPVGPSFSRAQLKVHAEGKISDIFGELFKQQDNYPVQVRMPTEPMLLADRVTGIDADPGSLKLGTVWTETDITDDAWYLHQGHIPPGIMIESGQADLFLISY